MLGIVYYVCSVCCVVWIVRFMDFSVCVWWLGVGLLKKCGSLFSIVLIELV